MKIEYEDLEAGDEIIVASGSNLRLLKVIEAPDVNLTEWRRKIRCKADIEIEKVIRKKWDHKTGNYTPYNSTRTVWKSCSDDYKKRKTVYVGGKDMWLVKRRGQLID